MFNFQETVDLLYLRKFIYHKKAINNNKYQDIFIKVIFVRVILIGMLHLFYTFIYRIKISLKNKCTIYHNMHLYEFAKY